MALGWTARLRALGVTVVMLWPLAAAADMLDEPACNQLKTEQQRLAAEGLKTDMLHGPDWAKANLPSTRMDQIKHLIEVEEQISFRCPLPPPPKGAEPAVAAPGDGEDAPKAAPKRKKAKKKADEPVGFELPDLDALTGKGAPAEKQQPKKTKKLPVEAASDAYVPPPSQGNSFVDGEAEPIPQGPPAGAPATKQ